MIPFPCKYQQTIVLNYGFISRCEMNFATIHSIIHNKHRELGVAIPRAGSESQDKLKTQESLDVLQVEKIATEREARRLFPCFFLSLLFLSATPGLL